MRFVRGFRQPEEDATLQDALPISRTTEFGGFGRGWFDREVSYKKVEKV